MLPAALGLVLTLLLATLSAIFYVVQRITRLETQINDMPERMESKMITLSRAEVDRCATQRGLRCES